MDRVRGQLWWHMLKRVLGDLIGYCQGLGLLEGDKSANVVILRVKTCNKPF